MKARHRVDLHLAPPRWTDSEDNHFPAELLQGLILTCLLLRRHLHDDVFMQIKTKRFVFVLPVHLHEYDEMHLKWIFENEDLSGDLGNGAGENACVNEFKK